MNKARLNVYIERDHGKRLDELAAMKNLSRSSVVAAALAAFLSPEGGERREVATAKRLDKLTRQFERLERDQTILIECMAQTTGWLVSGLTGFSGLPALASVKDGKIRNAVFPGDVLEIEGKVVHEGSGYAMGEAKGWCKGTAVCDAKLISPPPAAALVTE